MKHFLIIIPIIFILSCGGEDSSSSTGPGGSDTRPTITLSMSDNLELTIGLTRFGDVGLASISFNVGFNPAVLKLSSYVKGDYGDPLFAIMNSLNVNNDSTDCAFLFTSDLSSDGTLLKLNFQGSPSSYQGTTLFLDLLTLEDKNGDRIPTDTDDGVVIVYQTTCYISTHPTNDEILFDGEYQWTNQYCWPLNWETAD